MMVSRTALVVFALGVGSGCGTALHVTSVPYRSDSSEQLRRGAQALGCREHASEVFDLFFVCPPDARALGVSRSEGKVSLTCADLWPRTCVRLFERVRQAAGKDCPGTMAR